MVSYVLIQRLMDLGLLNIRVGDLRVLFKMR